jgi:hypothetical protein
MGGKQEEKPAPNSPLRRLLPALSPDWILPLLDLLRYLYRWLRPPQPEGIYEILDYDSTLEILDPEGETATFQRRQRIRFLQDNVIAFEDYAWGNGDLFAEYAVSPGIVVDRYREADRWNVLIYLRETKSRGDIEDFYIQRTVKHGFTKRQEWRQVEMRHSARQLRLSIIFPRERRCQRAVLVQRSRNRAIVLGPEHFTDLPDGRQVLAWETRNIRPLEIYTIRWSW